MATTIFAIWILLQSICAKAARIDDALMGESYDDDYDDDDNTAMELHNEELRGMQQREKIAAHRAKYRQGKGGGVRRRSGRRRKAVSSPSRRRRRRWWFRSASAYEVPPAEEKETSAYENWQPEEDGDDGEDGDDDQGDDGEDDNEEE